MNKNAKCPECGETFDVDVVRSAFNDQYKGQYDYDQRAGERLCYPCACLAADRGMWQESGAQA